MSKKKAAQSRFFCCLTGWMYAFPVGEGQDGAKTRNAVIEPTEMSYKRSIPLGLNVLLKFIPSAGGVGVG
ncbi:MAG: hypothetical protein ACK5C0_08420, partial [Candidatus Kapaibacterium sp.]